MYEECKWPNQKVQVDESRTPGSAGASKLALRLILVFICLEELAGHADGSSFASWTVCEMIMFCSADNLFIHLI
jgi:hypothetical protein